MGLALALANVGGGASAGLPLMPSTNLLGWWSARTTGTAGAGGTLSLTDLSGNGNAMGSVVIVTPMVLTASDPVCGNSPTVHSTAGSAGASASIASFSTPVTVYMVGYTTANGGDLVLLGATIFRLFIGLAGAAETWTFRVPTSGNPVSDAHGVNTTASVVCCTVPVTAGTFNSYIGQSTPATGTGTAGTIPTGQTVVQIGSAGGNVGGVLAELAIYSGADAQATRFAGMNILAQRCGLAAILT